MTTLARSKCPGKMVNTPYKRATRCAVCGQLDYEANEGDVCGRRAMLPETVS